MSRSPKQCRRTSKNIASGVDIAASGLSLAAPLVWGAGERQRNQVCRSCLDWYTLVSLKVVLTCIRWLTTPLIVIGGALLVLAL